MAWTAQEAAKHLFNTRPNGRRAMAGQQADTLNNDINNDIKYRLGRQAETGED
jgi:hypothetical protein